jgi:hypothetical protein
MKPRSRKTTKWADVEEGEPASLSEAALVSDNGQAGSGGGK